MIRPQVATKYNEIADALNELQDGRFLKKSSFDWRRLERECRALVEAKPSEGWTMLGVLYAAAGDVDGMNSAFSNAERLGMDVLDKLNWLSSCLRLGLFSRASAILVPFSLPEKGVLSELVSFFASIGAFQTFVSRLEEAKRMGIEVGNQALSEEIYEAARICALGGISDSDVLKHLDIAGQVGRKSGFAPQLRLSTHDVGGVFKGVTSMLGVFASSDEVFDLNVELAKEEESAGIVKNTLFDVVFVSASDSDELHS